MNTTLQIRIDGGTKTRARKVFRDMGVDMSTGVKMFLQQVINTESIPFDIRTKNGFTPKQEQKIIRETQYILKHGKSYKSAEEAHRDILGKK